MIGLALTGAFCFAAGVLVGIARHLPARHRYAQLPHLNPPEVLAPVACPLVLFVDGELVHGERTAHIDRRDRAMTYKTADGRELIGRYYWTYP